MDPEMRNREVNRAVVEQVRVVDPNNNQVNQPNNHLPVEPVQVGFAALPPVTTAIALLQVILDYISLVFSYNNNYKCFKRSFYMVRGNTLI